MWEPEIPQTSDDKKSQESNPRLVKGESLNFVKKIRWRIKERKMAKIILKEVTFILLSLFIFK